MKSILVLTKYGDLAATTRQRFLQYQEELESNGIRLIIEPLLNNEYLQNKFKGFRIKKLVIMRSYLRRLKLLILKKDFDAIWVQYELFPYLPSMFEKLISLPGKPVLSDFDDAIFHQYDDHSSLLFRTILKKKLDPLLKRSNLTICGNDYLQNWAKNHCSNTYVVPTVVDTTKYIHLKKKISKQIVIGWIGSPSTWNYVQKIKKPLNQILKTHNVTTLVVGSGNQNTPDNLFKFVDWSLESEISLIQSMDIGIMPLTEDLWSQGKCGYKLIQYMACGLPVIASPVGVNKKLVKNGVNGFLANSEEEWIEFLDLLIRDPELRSKMGAEGRKIVEKFYSLEVHGPRVSSIIGNLFV